MTEERLKAQIEALHASTSWKITAPLRYCAQALKISFWREMKLRLKIMIAGCLRDVSKIMLRHPALLNPARGILQRFPTLKMRLRRVLFNAPVAAYQIHSEVPKPTQQIQSADGSEQYVPEALHPTQTAREMRLSPAAYAILQELQSSYAYQGAAITFSSSVEPGPFTTNSRN